MYNFFFVGFTVIVFWGKEGVFRKFHTTLPRILVYWKFDTDGTLEHRFSTLYYNVLIPFEVVINCNGITNIKYRIFFFFFCNNTKTQELCCFADTANIVNWL